MAGYWMVRTTEIRDQDAIEQYRKLWPDIGSRYNAKILASRGEHKTVEGEDKPRNLLVEFPTYQDALDCYNDPDYAVAIEYMKKACDRELVIIESN